MHYDGAVGSPCMRPEQERWRAWLRHYYDRSGEGQSEFSKRIGISQGALSAYLSGRRGIGGEVLYKMSRAFMEPIDTMTKEWPPSRPTEAPTEAARRRQKRQGE